MSIRKNSFYNLAGSLAPIAVTLFTVPIYLRLIGTERYGVLVIVWAFLGYFGNFDLGLGPATAQRIATLHNVDSKERAEVFWTALTLNTTIGVVAGLLLWPVAQYFFVSHLKITEILRLEVLSAIPWMAAAVPVATISGVLGGTLQGLEKFFERNVCSVLGTVLFQLFPLGVAWLYAPDLSILVPAALFGRVVTFVLFFALCYRHVPLNMTPSVKRSLLAPLFRFGSWVTVTSLISPLLTTLDRFLIGSIAGAKALTYYTVPFNLVSRIEVLPSSLSNTLFPRFSATSEDERRRLMDVAISSLNVILTPLIITGILIIDPFLRWWVGPDMAKSASYVGEIIALGLWFNCQAYIPYARLQAQGRPDLVAMCHLIEIIPYLAFLAVAMSFWGVVGAALAWSLRVIVDAVLLFWLCRVVSRDFLVYLAPLPLLGMVATAVIAFPFESLYRWTVGGSALLITLAWAWWSAPDSVKRLFRDVYKSRPLRNSNFFPGNHI